MKKYLLVFVIAALVGSGAFAASPDIDSKLEIHGKPWVKLTEKVTFPVSTVGNGLAAVVWLPDGSVFLTPLFAAAA